MTRPTFVFSLSLGALCPALNACVAHTAKPGETADSTDTDTAPDDSIPTIPDSDSTTETDTDESTDSVESGDTGDVPAPPTPDIIVDCNGGGDHLTIAAAITAAISGTTIGLMPCTYTENVNFIGKAVDIYGIDGSAVTTIEGLGSGPVITAIRGETIGTRLAGVTVTGGGGDYGAGLLMDGSVLALEDVVFTGNNRTYAVVYGQGISVTMIDVDFHDNRFHSGGVVTYIDNGNMLAERLYLSCGSADMGIYQHNATLLLDSTIDCPDASYAVYVDSSEFASFRSRITGGNVGVYGADSADTFNERMWLFNSIVVGTEVAVKSNYMHFKADNVVFWGGTKGLDIYSCHADSYVYNSAFHGTECAMEGDPTEYAIGWNSVGDSDYCRTSGFSTIVGDPMFVDPPNDFHLLPGSPLIDAGDPDGDHDDADGSRCDVGGYGGLQGAW